jgi:hypothetical protein
VGAASVGVADSAEGVLVVVVVVASRIRPTP